MLPLRLVGSVLVSWRRICGHAARSARLLHQRLPHGRPRAMGVALSAVALVGVGGMSLYNFKAEYNNDEDDDEDDDDEDDEDDVEKSVVVAARKPTHHHQEVLEEDETVEEKAVKRRFEEWMIKYGRRYRDKKEKAMRYELFRRTAQRVDELNSRPGALATVGTTCFADRTNEERPSRPL